MLTRDWLACSGIKVDDSGCIDTIVESERPSRDAGVAANTRSGPGIKGVLLLELNGLSRTLTTQND